MEREFWLARWSNQEIGFHQAQVNPWLKRCWPQLGVSADATVLVPLCGKSLDLGWLAEQGHAVVGVELAEDAVRSYYEEANEAFRVERERHFLRYDGSRVTIFCGDFMDLTALLLPGVNAVYDRAALIALPPRMRAHYADHLQRIVPDGCRMLLLTLEYDQARVPGPPHSVEEAEVRTLFETRCGVERVCSTTVTELPPKFAQNGVTEAQEVAYRVVKIA
jgi:thiopurine S-methyltransferase